MFKPLTAGEGTQHGQVVRLEHPYGLPLAPLEAEVRMRLEVYPSRRGEPRQEGWRAEVRPQDGMLAAFHAAWAYGSNAMEHQSGYSKTKDCLLYTSPSPRDS